MDISQRLMIGAVALALVALFVALPALIAIARQHPERRTILRLAPLSALSFVLWAALIAWAVSDKRDDAVISKYVARLRERNLLPWLVGGLVAAGIATGAWATRSLG